MNLVYGEIDITNTPCYVMEYYLCVNEKRRYDRNRIIFETLFYNFLVKHGLKTQAKLHKSLHKWFWDNLTADSCDVFLCSKCGTGFAIPSIDRICKEN